MSTTKILVVDNYDSFVYTLVGYLQELGAETTVVRNDDVTLAEAIEMAETRDGVLISPGPGSPAEAGVCIELIKWCGEHSKPMFGVCLGHQALAEAYGGIVTHAPELMHGKTSLVQHDGSSVFAGLPSPSPPRATTRWPPCGSPFPTSSKSLPRPPAAWSWGCSTAPPRCAASSSTRNRSSPKAATRCWATGSNRSA